MKYTDEFERFWKAWPTRWNRDLGLNVKRKKAPAFVKWQKLSEEIKAEIFSKLKYVKKAEGGASSVRDAVTWLNQEGWDEIELPKNVKPFPPELLPNMKTVPGEVDSNLARTEQRKALAKVKEYG